MTTATTETKPTADTSVKVRIGTLDDLDEVMALSLAAVEDNGFLNADPQEILKTMYPALAQDRGIVGVIEEPDGSLSGGVLIVVSQHWYAGRNDIFLEEKSVFVHPDFRNAKGGRAARLVEFAKRVSDTLGLPLLIGVLSSDRTAGKIRLYRRVFGEPQGAFFLYNGTTGAHHSETEH